MIRRFSHQQGFGIMEVLAAILVLAVGVLGFAALQVRALQTSGDSYFRTQAMEIAQDLAERIHVNPTKIGSYRAYAWNPSTFPPTAVTVPSSACSGSTNKNLDDIVTCDITDVLYNAQSLLPQGMVNVAPCEGLGSGVVMDCVYVSWNGTLPRKQAAATPDNSCYLSTGTYAKDAQCVMLEI